MNDRTIAILGLPHEPQFDELVEHMAFNSDLNLEQARRLLEAAYRDYYAMHALDLAPPAVLH